MLNFSKGVVVNKIDDSRKVVTHSDVETVLVNALEGGSNHWYLLHNDRPEFNNKPKDISTSQWVAKLILEGEQVVFSDLGQDLEGEFVLTLEKLLDGVDKNAKERPFDSDIENGDSVTADCILQYALFNEVVFG